MMNVAIISARGAEHVDFDAVSRAARGSIEHIVRHLLPDARRQGHELVAVNPTRADNRPGSFKINAATGVWSDFATNEKGGDMIDLWAYIRSVPKLDAARKLGDFLGMQRGGLCSAPVPASQSAAIAALTPDEMKAAPASLPARTMPRADGKPHFTVGNPDGPHPLPGEKRRHVYRLGGVAVKVKIMLVDRGAVTCYKVMTDQGETGWQFAKPEAFRQIPYFVEPWPFASETLCWPEGEKDCDSLARVGLAAFTFGGTGDGLPEGAAAYAAGHHIVILTDNDESGRKHAEAKARAIAGVAASVRIVGFPELSEKADVSDFLAAGGTIEELSRRIAEAPIWIPQAAAAPAPVAGAAAPSWNEPVELPTGLKPVNAFDFEFLPAPIAPWVQDISERMQCPPDFVAVSAMVALGATLGRRVGIRPQRRTNWIEVPNLWGCIVGRPGAMKSPAMAEALKPLHRLESQAHAANEAALRDFSHARDVYELRKQDAQAKAKAALKKGGEVELHQIDEPTEPRAQRFIVNDATYEKLGEILADNPNGVLAHRDELVSLLKPLDREEAAPARGFFLTAWNGTGGYTFDRIIRGQTRIEAACLSMLGSTQPGRIAEYMRRAISGGAGDDGLIQRFGLLVWPDQSPEWIEADRYPDSNAKSAAWETFTRLAELTPAAVQAENDEFEPIPFLRFDEAARELFADWHRDLERRLRSGDLHPAMESHLSKYRKLVPALALINHLAEGQCGPVGDVATLRAIAMSGYLESHARRLYGAGIEAETSAAKAILAHVRRGDLEDGFTARDIHQRGWSNLSDKDQVSAGLALLDEFEWVRAELIRTTGRAKTVYRINPRAKR